MASTYSTNLALELIGTGDQAGTWGTTTNTNLGTLLEQAISGYVTQTITDGADTVITIPNGASGVARNMFIECTGTTTADRNLIVPNNKKLYFIYNNTIGGYTVTVKTSAGAGIKVAYKAKMVLVCDGTNVVAAMTPTITAGGANGNISFGADANYKITTGANNIAIGESAAINTTTGADNVSIGATAGWTAPAALGTVSVGSQAHYGNVNAVGDFNIAIGYIAGYDGSTGQKNIAIGYAAYAGDGTSSQTGGNNTCIGPLAGSQLTTQSDMTIIGGATGASSGSGDILIADGSGNIRANYIHSISRWYFYSGGTLNLMLDGSSVIANSGLMGYQSYGITTQNTSRTTGVTANSPSGAIQLVAAAGSTAWTSFTLTNIRITTGCMVLVSQRSGTDKYQINVTNTAAGSCQITFATTGGTTTEQPVFNFCIIKA